MTTETLAKFLGLANELTLDADGWALIPYGDSLHSGKNALRAANAKSGEQVDSPKPVIQRFDRKAAEEIVSDFKSTWSRIKRAVVGLPVFKGHPDCPRWEKHFPDKTPRGAIADMEARDNGLAIKPVLTEQGAREVEGGWSAFSPFWNNRLVDDSGPQAIYSPFKLWSIGLLPPGRENIKGLSLANAAEPEVDDTLTLESETNMKNLLIKLLAAHGITLAPDATDAECGACVDKACSDYAAANAAEIEVCLDGKATKLRVPDAISKLLATANAKITDLEAAAVTAKAATETQLAEKTKAAADAIALANAKDAELAAANAKLKTEREARSRVIIVGAISKGKIPAAELEQKVVALANAADFDAEIAKIEALAPKLRTQSAVGAITKTGKEQMDRQQQFIALVNARMDSDEIQAMPPYTRYDAAFERVMKDPANATLVAAMKKPEVVTK